MGEPLALQRDAVQRAVLAPQVLQEVHVREAAPRHMADQILRGQTVAVLVHVGPFSGLRDACERLQEWAGERAAGPFWESYVTNPREEPDSSRWVTEIFLPLR